MYIVIFSFKARERKLSNNKSPRDTHKVFLIKTVKMGNKEDYSAS